MGSSKKRAKILVETLEDRYNEALATKGTLARKAQAGIRLMESVLNKIENGVHAVRDRGLSGALDKGWKAVDTGLTHAQEAVHESMGHTQTSQGHAPG